MFRGGECYGVMGVMEYSKVSSIVTATTGKAFLIARPAVIAGSSLLNDRFVCPSTRNRKRWSVGRACPFGFSAAGGFGLVNIGRGGIVIPGAVLAV